MRLAQAIKMAAKSIMAKKGRSFLTMLGIIIGIASVMSIVSAVMGYSENMKSTMAAQMTQVSVSLNLSSGESSFPLIYDYCSRLGDVVVGVTPNAECGGTIKYGARITDNMDWQNRPRAYFASEKYSSCNLFKIARGRDLSRLDVEKYNQVCVLGARAAKALFDYADPLGQTIMIGSVPFVVVGIYEERDAASSYSQDSIIALPYTTSRFFSGESSKMNECMIRVKDAESVMQVVNSVQSYITSLTQDNTLGYGYAYSDQEWINQSSEALGMISVVLGGIAGISLLVGGIGIMNIMLVTVTERTREIGIRRAIGAERSSIVAQFLIEAAMLCGIGGIIGIAIGVGGTRLIGKFLLNGMVLMPSPMITLGAFAFSVTLGIIFGLYPAIKASGLQPVVALRAD